MRFSYVFISVGKKATNKKTYSQKLSLKMNTLRTLQTTLFLNLRIF